MSNKENNTYQRKLISNMVRSIGEKNYADAHKFLKKTIESKLLSKINTHKDINIFTHE